MHPPPRGPAGAVQTGAVQTWAPELPSKGCPTDFPDVISHQLGSLQTTRGTLHGSKELVSNSVDPQWSRGSYSHSFTLVFGIIYNRHMRSLTHSR